MTKKTKDLYLAAAFLSVGAELVNTDRSDPKHMEFEFSEFKKFSTDPNSSLPPVNLSLEKLELDWTNKTLLVNAQEYADAVRRMKSLVHSY